MPSSRAVLNDLCENELNPLKPHTHLHNGHLVSRALAKEPIVNTSMTPVVEATCSVTELVQISDDVSIENIPKTLDESKKPKPKRNKVHSAVD